MTAAARFHRRWRFFAAVLVMSLLGLCPARAQSAAPRLALVIGEAHYRVGPLATPANDAGLIAQSLALAGFEVTGYADLDRAAIREAFAAFVGKARQAGPEATVVVYLAGYGLQFDGGDFLVPIEARVARDVDVPLEAVPLVALSHDLEAVPLKARIFVYDLARPHAFAQEGSALAGGLAPIEPAAGSIVAFNTAPGTVAAPDQGLYGLYAQALSEMIQAKGVPIETMFTRLRARVNALTNGAGVPWNAGTLEAAFALFPPAAASAAEPSPRPTPPIATLSADAAYWASVQRDTLQAYGDFLKAFPDDTLAPRVLAFAAARREAATFAESARLNTAPAYWTYMRRYPRGPHFADARRQLAAIPAAVEPPPRFEPVAFADLPAPRPAERDIIDKPFVMFDDEDYAPIQAPPSVVVPERRVAFYDRLPPLLAIADGALPLPLPIPLGFAAESGRIVQPEVGGRPGPIVATDAIDKAGHPVVTQTGPGDHVLSTASVTVAPDGTRTVTQTGPTGQAVATIVQSAGRQGDRRIVQTGADKRVIATLATRIERNGNRMVTLSGPDDEPVSIETTTPSGAILKPKGTGGSRFVGPQPMKRPVVLERIAKPAVASKPDGVTSDAGKPDLPKASVPTEAPIVAKPVPAVAPSVVAPLLLPQQSPVVAAPAPTPNATPSVSTATPVVPVAPKAVAPPVAPVVPPMAIPEPVVPAFKPVLPPVVAPPIAPVVTSPQGPAPIVPPAEPRREPASPPAPVPPRKETPPTPEPAPAVKPKAEQKKPEPQKLDQPLPPQRPKPPPAKPAAKTPSGGSRHAPKPAHGKR